MNRIYPQKKSHCVAGGIPRILLLLLLAAYNVTLLSAGETLARYTTSAQGQATARIASFFPHIVSATGFDEGSGFIALRQGACAGELTLENKGETAVEATPFFVNLETGANFDAALWRSEPLSATLLPGESTVFAMSIPHDNAQAAAAKEYFLRLDVRVVQVD